MACIPYGGTAAQLEALHWLAFCPGMLRWPAWELQVTGKKMLPMMDDALQMPDIIKQTQATMRDFAHNDYPAVVPSWKVASNNPWLKKQLPKAYFGENFDIDKDADDDVRFNELLKESYEEHLSRFADLLFEQWKLRVLSKALSLKGPPSTAQ